MCKSWPLVHSAPETDMHLEVFLIKTTFSSVTMQLERNQLHAACCQKSPTKLRCFTIIRPHFFQKRLHCRWFDLRTFHYASVSLCLSLVKLVNISHWVRTVMVLLSLRESLKSVMGVEHSWREKKRSLKTFMCSRVAQITWSLSPM